MKNKLNTLLKRHHHCPFTIKEEKAMIQKYIDNPKLSCRQLAFIYKMDYQAMCRIFQGNKIKIDNTRTGAKKTYSCDENYFDKIDNEEKAYVLGLLYADGCVCGRKDIVLSLQERDVDILKKIKKLFKSDRPLHYIKSKKIEHQSQYKFYLYSDRLVKKLNKLGCMRRKSLILKFPTKKQVPTRLLKHFMRGYLDGDGCICTYFRKSSRYLKCKVCIASTYSFLNQYKKECKKQLNINFSLKRKKNYGNTIYNYASGEMSLGGISDIIKFCNWIYKDATIYLERKYDKFKKFEKSLKRDRKRWNKAQKKLLRNS